MGRRGAARWWPWAAFACGGVRGGGVCGDAYATRAACDADANGTGLPCAWSGGGRCASAVPATRAVRCVPCRLGPACVGRGDWAPAVAVGLDGDAALEPLRLDVLPASLSGRRAAFYAAAASAAPAWAARFGRRNATLVVRGPPRDGFWVRALMVLSQSTWAVMHGATASPRLEWRADPYGGVPDGWRAYFEAPDDAGHAAASAELDCVAVDHVYPNPPDAYPRTAAAARRTRSLRSLQVAAFATPTPAAFERVAETRRRLGLAGARVLGVHLRGTDKKRSLAGPVVPPADYFPIVDAWLAAFPDAAVFLATDDAAFERAFRGRYGRNVTSRAGVDRGDARAAVWARGPPPPGTTASAGDQVLDDALLLAACDYLLKAASAVSEFAIYYNPSLIANSFDFSIADAAPPPFARNARVRVGAGAPRPRPARRRRPAPRGAG